MTDMSAITTLSFKYQNFTEWTKIYKMDIKFTDNSNIKFQDLYKYVLNVIDNNHITDINIIRENNIYKLECGDIIKYIKKLNKFIKYNSTSSSKEELSFTCSDLISLFNNNDDLVKVIDTYRHEMTILNKIRPKNNYVDYTLNYIDTLLNI